MRTRNLFIALTMMTATAAITACSNDDNLETVDLNKPIDLNLSIGQPGTNTRASVSNGGSASTFTSGDEISLTAVTKAKTGDTPVAIDVEGATYRNTLTYTYGTGLPAGEAFYWQNTSDTHSFYAYYPAQTNFPKKADDASYTYTHSFTLPTTGSNIDNSTLAKLNEANFMYGKKDAKATNEHISLELSHCMSQITFTVEKGAGYTASEAMPTITKAEILNGSGLYTTGTFNLSAGTVTASTSGVTAGIEAITPYRPTATATTWYAIVFPGQAFANHSAFIRFTTSDDTSGSTTYTYNLESALTCTANTSYNYALKLNRGSVTLSGLTIAQWTKTDKSGNAGMDFPGTTPQP